MNMNIVKEINEKALNINGNLKLINESSEECLLENESDGKKRYCEYKHNGLNKVMVNIYDSIKDGQDIRRAAEFICSFDASHVLENYSKKTYGLSGIIHEDVFVEL